MVMKKVVCVFAHPDDEAMGPGGTLAKLSQEGEVYLLCATSGNVSDNDQPEKLAQVRRDELLASAKILGIKKVDFLGFDDGQLNNNSYQQLVEKISEKVTEYQPDTLLTFNINGVTGHLDHIAVALATSFVFQKTDFIQTLLYFCLEKSMQEQWAKNYFIFIPPGYSENEVDEVVDVSAVWQQKLEAIKAHHSQQGDVDNILKLLENLGKKSEFFLKTTK